MEGRHGRHPGIARRSVDRVHRWVLRQGTRERVLAPAGADHQDVQFAGHGRRSYGSRFGVPLGGVPLRGALLGGALVVGAAVAGGIAGGFTDLHVYRYAGRAVLDHQDLYASDDPVTGLPFTYPPFAAVALVPLALLPGWVAAAAWTAAGAGCLAASVALVLRAQGTPAPAPLVVALTVAALALEPVWQNAAFGQVNTLLMLMVLADLLRPERRWSGVLLGVAAGLKLTPLAFVVLLVMVGHRGAAARALLAFAATVVAGLVAVPGAASYWADGLLSARRVGPPALAHNQSLYGALTRLHGEPAPAVLWAVLAVPLALAVLVVAAAWWRHGDRVLGTCLAAAAMLLASPVSWSHHWVWAVPAALALWRRSRAAAVAWTAVFVARPMLWPPWAEGREYGWSAGEHVVGNAYALAALALAAGAAVALRARSRRRPADGRSVPH